jgi:hypothetical protein
VSGEYPLDAHVLAHNLSDMVVGAHKAAALVQANSGAELNGERSKMFDVGLEISNRKHYLLGIEFLSACG